MSSDRKVLVGACPGVTLQSTLRVDVFRSPEDGWTDVVEKLAAMETGPGHQYLDGPRDDVQVMASFEEYGDEWWNRHAN
jgi:hypothetical protein